MRDGFKTKRIIMRDYSKYDGIPSICTLEHVSLLLPSSTLLSPLCLLQHTSLKPFTPGIQSGWY